MRVVAGRSIMGSDEGILEGLERKRASRRLVGSKRPLFMISGMRAYDIFVEGHADGLRFRRMWDVVWLRLVLMLSIRFRGMIRWSGLHFCVLHRNIYTGFTGLSEWRNRYPTLPCHFPVHLPTKLPIHDIKFSKGLPHTQMSLSQMRTELTDTPNPLSATAVAAPSPTSPPWH